MLSETLDWLLLWLMGIVVQFRARLCASIVLLVSHGSILLFRPAKHHGYRTVGAHGGLP